MRVALLLACAAPATGVAGRVRLFAEEGQITGSSALAAAHEMSNGPAITRAQYRRDDEPERSMSDEIIIRYA
jgi:hypothetical protein